MSGDGLGLLHKREALDPEFEPYMYEDESLGTCIKHPLWYSIMHIPELNAVANYGLRQKKERLQQVRRDGNWSAVIGLHERPWRLHAFQQVADALGDEDYWSLLRGIWTDSENIWQNELEWIEMLGADRSCRSRFMTEADAVALREMGTRVMIYRGFHRVDREWGLSWSIDREQAEWFAMRFDSKDPRLSIGEVQKDLVIGYLTDRNEDEIVVLPEHVELLEIVDL